MVPTLTTAGRESLGKDWFAARTVREQSFHEQGLGLLPPRCRLGRTLRTVVCEWRGIGGAKGRRVGAASSESVGSQSGRPRCTRGANNGDHARARDGRLDFQPGSSSGEGNRPPCRRQRTRDDAHLGNTSGRRRICQAASTTRPGRPHTRESLLVVRRGSLGRAKRLSPAAAEAAFGRRAHPVIRLCRTIVRARSRRGTRSPG
jgi:hypothetical protein